MKDNLSRYTLRVEQVLLDKLGYIAEYEGRTKNRELEQMIKKRISDFEKSTERSHRHKKETAKPSLFYVNQLPIPTNRQPSAKKNARIPVTYSQKRFAPSRG